jgi:hypothetical protein
LAVAVLQDSRRHEEFPALNPLLRVSVVMPLELQLSFIIITDIRFTITRNQFR